MAYHNRFLFFLKGSFFFGLFKDKYLRDRKLKHDVTYSLLPRKIVSLQSV